MWSDHFLTSRNHFHEIVWKHSLFPVQFTLTPANIYIHYICDDVSNFQREFVVLLRLVAKSNASSSTYQQTRLPFNQPTKTTRRFEWETSRRVILTHGDSNIKEQLRKYSQKRKVVLHLENYEDNFNFSWKEFSLVNLEEFSKLMPNGIMGQLVAWYPRI